MRLNVIKSENSILEFLFYKPYYKTDVPELQLRLHGSIYAIRGRHRILSISRKLKKLAALRGRK